MMIQVDLNSVMTRAGCLYIFEVSSALLPCCSLPLAGSCLTSQGDSSSALQITTSSASVLTLTCHTQEALQWLEEVCKYF